MDPTPAPSRPSVPADKNMVGYPAEADMWASLLDQNFGGRNIDGASNIVFSSGLLDPWSAAGVYAGDGNPPAPGAYDGPVASPVGAPDRDVQSVVIDLGAHHLDLMFSDDNDPASVIEARQVEAAAIKRWTGGGGKN